MPLQTCWGGGIIEREVNDGKIEKIEIIHPNEQVLVETRGIEKGQILKAGKKLEYIVRVCIPEGTKIKEDITSKIEVFTEIVQDDKQIFNEPIHVMLHILVVQHIQQHHQQA